MDIRFSNFVSTSANYIYFIKDEISISLTPFQKRIALVAFAILSCLALGYVSYQYYFRAKKLDGEMQSDTHEVVVAEEKNPKVLLTIPERLEKNRKYAQEQQDKEVAKRFTLKKGDLTDFKPPIQGEEKKTICTKQVGIASCQGIRPTMEDADLVEDALFRVQDTEYAFEVFGVFDGHGGSTASAFVKAHLMRHLKESLEEHNQEALTDEGIFHALKGCFKKLDEKYQEDDGTTATVAVILDGKIWVANVGDSRTILYKDGNVIQASEDAKPSIKRYCEKIKRMGGKVIFNRINGLLAVARAIGDKNVIGITTDQRCVSPNPKITCFSRQDFDNGYLVLACDGLYDVATTNEVGEAIQTMVDENASVEEMSKRLVHSAIVSGSRDNVSVMVVKL